VPTLPIVIDLSLIALALGALLIIRLVGGSMPWGQLTIATGPDGRPMRPRVHWHLWSISRGEPPWQAVAAGAASIALGGLALVFVGPKLADTIVRPASALPTYLMAFAVGTSCTIIPLGVVVLMRGVFDLIARRSQMMGVIVGMRRDVAVFGRTYRIAVQAGDRAMTRGLWAEAFRIDRAAFDRLQPGDRVTIDYSPRLRYVYTLLAPALPVKRAAS
jgi:hypothetical protein